MGKHSQRESDMPYTSWLPCDRDRTSVAGLCRCAHRPARPRL